jgi:tetratricopeptide (TPR) repeat protein
VRVLLRRGLPIGLLCACVATERPAAQAPTAIGLLDRYARGECEPVVAALQGAHDFDALLKQLKHDGEAWMSAGGPADRSRRELTAATFALEAARADAWTEWKIVQRNRPFPDPSIYWRSPPLLIQWASALFLRDRMPRPIERWWQLAAASVAERAEDFEFLIGSPFEARGNPHDEIEFLRHVLPRFPHETRFVLAQAIALDWRTWPDRPRGRASGRPGTREAQQVYQNLLTDPAVGSEAAMRLGVLRLRSGAVDAAIDLFNRSDDRTRDPYVLYLARYFKGQALERKKQEADAEHAYRSALSVVPQAQSASIALGALLFRRDARLEASGVVEANLSARPQPVDPWRTYADADDRFWPDLVNRLRAEIHR